MRININLQPDSVERKKKAFLRKYFRKVILGEVSLLTGLLAFNFLFGVQTIILKNKLSLINKEWKTTEWPKGYPPSVLDISLKRNGNRTTLTMVQSNVPKEQIDSYREGWKTNYWDLMNEYFKGTGKK